MSTRRFRTTAPVLPYRESRSQRESRAQLVHSGPRQNLIVLYLVPIVLLAAMACWRISAAVTAQHPSAPRGSYALMIPRSDASTREAGANRSLRIASARRSNLGAFCLRTTDGQQIYCSADDYRQIRERDTISARVIFVPSATPRSTPWITSATTE